MSVPPSGVFVSCFIISLFVNSRPGERYVIIWTINIGWLEASRGLSIDPARPWSPEDTLSRISIYALCYRRYRNLSEEERERAKDRKCGLKKERKKKDEEERKMGVESVRTVVVMVASIRRNQSRLKYN